MGFKCGIVGLPNVGKSTLFNALTESSKAEAANYPFATIEPNVGRVAVPDLRLKILSDISKSQKIIPTYIDFVDIAGLVKGASKGEGLGNKFLSHIREVDAIAHVVRCFEDKNITHVSSSIDPLNDIDTILTELKLSDLETLENKLQNLKKKSKSFDKDIINEIDFIEEVQENLNLNKKIDKKILEEKKLILLNSLNLISFKPVLYVCNVDEKSIKSGNELSNLVKNKALEEGNDVVLISAEIESQIAEFDNENDRQEMLDDLKLEESSLKKVVRTGYDLLELITFFTSGIKETRAWTISKNTLAPTAGGKIHSDFENGFIRVETITYSDFIEYKGESSCRNLGKLRQEGKDYIIKDGDICHFLFNV